MRNDPQRRAQAVTAFFTVAFILLSPLPVLLGHVPESLPDLMSLMPVLIFFGLLLVHTYFAVRCFAIITPPTLRLPKILDVILVALYLLLPFSLWFGPLMYLVATFLFAVASVKYTLLVGRTTTERLVQKKLLVDLLGVIGCLIAHTGALFGYWTVVNWVFSAGFTVVTMYLFFIHPLYVLDDGQARVQAS